VPPASITLRGAAPSAGVNGELRLRRLALLPRNTTGADGAIANGADATSLVPSPV
jgi:hypothetical protein